MLKKIHFILFLSVNLGFSQVSIGTTTPNANAALEVNSTDKGVLITQVPLVLTTNSAPLTAHVAGMIVYNTATAGDVTPGFYYNDGTRWNRVENRLYGAWSLTGNSGTNPTFNYIGTADNAALSFRTRNDTNNTLETNGTLTHLNSGNSTFVGENAGINDNLGGNVNVFVGMNAGGSNTSGNRSTAVGSNCYASNTNGTNNNAIGFNAMHTMVSSDHNVAIGSNSMYNGTADRNVSIGTESLFLETTGFRNTAVGYQSSYNITSGQDNVAVGNSTLTSVTDQNFNTAVGYLAYAVGNFRNSTAIGYNTFINNNNIVHLGNTSITNVSGQVNYTTYSDRRIKNNIKEDVVGSDFILNLRPVTYNFDIDKQNKLLGITDNSKDKSKYDIEKIKFSGFIAQEVEKTAEKANYDFSGVKTPKTDNQLYNVSYAEFVVPLVKTLQEQRIRLLELKKELEELKN